MFLLENICETKVNFFSFWNVFFVFFSKNGRKKKFLGWHPPYTLSYQDIKYHSLSYLWPCLE